MSKIAIVIGRNYSARLGMIRAAGAVGYRVIDVQTKPQNGKVDLENIDASSRFVQSAYSIPQTTHEALIDFVLQKTHSIVEKAVLLPTDDFSAAAIDTQQEKLRDKYLFPHIKGNPGEIVAFMDKKIQKELARKAGLNTVDTWEVTFQDGKYIIPKDIKYPVFIKPQVSFQGVKSVMQRCDSQELLEKALMKIGKKFDCSILVEEFVEIEKEYDVPGFACKDIIYTPGMIEKEIIHRGVTATGTIYPMNQYGDVGEKIKAFMHQLEFTGLFDLELYLCQGKIYFNELNLRFGASGFAMTGSGINMPAMLISTLNKEISPSFVPLVQIKNFVSEKTCLESYADGEISWKKFKSRVDDSDIHFIQSTNDTTPWKYFKRQQRVMHIKKEIKKLLK